MYHKKSYYSHNKNVLNGITTKKNLSLYSLRNNFQYIVLSNSNEYQDRLWEIWEIYYEFPPQQKDNYYFMEFMRELGRTTKERNQSGRKYDVHD